MLHHNNKQASKQTNSLGTTCQKHTGGTESGEWFFTLLRKVFSIFFLCCLFFRKTNKSSSSRNNKIIHSKLALVGGEILKQVNIILCSNTTPRIVFGDLRFNRVGEIFSLRNLSVISTESYLSSRQKEQLVVSTFAKWLIIFSFSLIHR